MAEIWKAPWRLSQWDEHPKKALFADLAKEEQSGLQISF